MRVGVFDYYPLCHSRGPSDDRGLFPALIEYVAEQENWKIEYVPGTVSENLDRLKHGSIDLVPAVATETQSGQGLTYTRETVISTWAQIYCAPQLDIQSALDLDGHLVAVVRDDPYNEELRRLASALDIDSEFVEVKHYSDAMVALEKGWVQAAAVDRLFGVLSEDDYSARRTPIVFAPLELRFAARIESDRSLIDALDYHVKRLKNDPDSIYYQRLEQLLSPDPNSRILHYFRIGLSVALGLLLFSSGVLVVLRRQVKAQTAQLSEQNRQLASEIEMRRQAEDVLMRQKEYLVALNETALGLMWRLDIDDLLEAITARAASLVGTPHGFILLPDAEGGQMVIRVGLGGFEPLSGRALTPGEGLLGQMRESREPILIEDYPRWPRRLNHPELGFLTAVMAVPLEDEDGLAGVIGLGCSGDCEGFDYEALEALKQFGELANIALENARLHRELRDELSQRREAEVALARLAAALEQAAESVVIADVRGVIRYVNPSFEKETGFRADEVIGTRDFLGSSEEGRNVTEEVWNTLASGEPWTGRYTSRRRDGSTYDVEATVSPVRNSESQEITDYVCVRRDVSQEVRMERQLRHVQKMEAIGTLAGGVAHDFNNVLFPIIGYTELAMKDLPTGTRAHSNLRGVLDAAHRARDLVQQILRITRQEEQERRAISLEPLVKEALRLLRASLPSTIEIVRHIDKDMGFVMADPTQMHQVVMNLCTNAYHAMRETGGRLEVALKRTRFDEGAVDPALDPTPGEYMHLCVSDTGPGIEPHIAERIFDPYFTTKGPGEGTGLGLALVHGVVTGHQGFVNVETVPGRGATFNVYLPLAEAAALELQPTREQRDLSGDERILVVDDEESIVAMLQQMLGEYGYRVRACTSSADALRLIRQDPHGFDLLVTDYTMPHVTGTQLAEEALALRPDLPVVLCTGYSDVVNERRARRIGIREYLLKPVSEQELVRTVRRALDECPADEGIEIGSSRADAQGPQPGE